jgi:hypothetical protein
VSAHRNPPDHNVLLQAYSSLAEQVEAELALSRHGVVRRRLMGLAAAALLPGVTGCGGGSGGSGGSSTSGSSGSGASGSSSRTAATIVHPGLLHTEADFSRMRSKLAAGAEPWVAGWNALTSSSRAQLGQTPNAIAVVIRGGAGENFRTMVEDMERTYQIALRWKVSGDTAYADLAVQFLNAWSSTMTTLTGNNDQIIAAGLYGYQWANAAEIMRSYSGWASTDVAKFQKLLLDVFYPWSHQFLIDHNGSDITNFWASWDALSLCGIYAIGVFCDRTDLCTEAISYYKTGRGNGASAHAVYMFHPGHLGQWQESGRDQGHSTLSVSCTTSLCEMAWNQGVDMYGYANNRFLAGAEYVAKSNLKDASGNSYSLPFATYVNRQGTSTVVSTSGQPNLRPCWESIYNHYVNRKGLSAPWVKAMAAQLRPDGNEWGGDDLSFGTLTFSRDAYSGDVAPSGLTGSIVAGKVLLSWWGSAYANSYNVKRGTSASGPFVTLASVTDPRTYTDASGNGSWYYAITAVTASGETGVSNVVRVTLPSEARALLPLNASSGTSAADTSGFGQHGTLNGGASWGAGRTSGNALTLDGTSGYVALPAGILSDLSDFTISLWVYWATQTTNARVFDFGSSDIAYMGLIPKDSSGAMRFMISGTTWYGDQSVVSSSALPTSRWVHVAVTLSGTTGTLYVDGAAVATNNAITFAPFQMGNTSQNWLGRSQYSADPHFNGRMQDLRIYDGALTASEIAALAAA